MILHLRILLIHVFILLFTFTSEAQVDDICALPNTSFQDGEYLKYKLYYNLGFIWIPAGEVTFNLSESDSTYDATITGRSYGSYDNIFKVRDEFYTSIDKGTMQPINFLRKVEEGDHRRYDSLSFDYDNQLIYSLNGDSIEVAKKDTFPLLNCAQNLVSIMYNLRNIPLDKYGRGDSIRGNIFFDKEYSPITIAYLKKEKKKVKGIGKFQTVKVRPKVIIGSVFKEDDVMNIWVSDDENKIPLLIESPILIGKVKAILSEYKGLKYPLTN